MAQRDPERYTQGDDGLIAEKVGSWAVDKLKIVTDYVYASGGARQKYAGTGAAYIDPFCGPGRSLIREQHRSLAILVAHGTRNLGTASESAG
jgi:hypothetical protein